MAIQINIYFKKVLNESGKILTGAPETIPAIPCFPSWNPEAI